MLILRHATLLFLLSLALAAGAHASYIPKPQPKPADLNVSAPVAEPAPANALPPENNAETSPAVPEKEVSGTVPKGCEKPSSPESAAAREKDKAACEEKLNSPKDLKLPQTEIDRCKALLACVDMTTIGEVKDDKVDPNAQTAGPNRGLEQPATAENPAPTGATRLGAYADDSSYFGDLAPKDDSSYFADLAEPPATEGTSLAQTTTEEFGLVADESGNEILEGNPAEDVIDPANKAPDMTGRSLIAQSRNPPVVTCDDFYKKHQCGLSAAAFNALNCTYQKFGRKVGITSGRRFAPLNGVTKSQHLVGNAVDLDLSGMGGSERYNLTLAGLGCGFTSVGTYSNSPNMLHLDVRQNATTWHWGSSPVPSWRTQAMVAAGWRPGQGPSAAQLTASKFGNTYLTQASFDTKLGTLGVGGSFDSKSKVFTPNVWWNGYQHTPQYNHQPGTPAGMSGLFPGFGSLLGGGGVSSGSSQLGGGGNFPVFNSNGEQIGLLNGTTPNGLPLIILSDDRDADEFDGTQDQDLNRPENDTPAECRGNKKFLPSGQIRGACLEYEV